MIAAPAIQSVVDFLASFVDEEEEPQAVTRTVSIRLETNRGKFVTVGDVLLVDLPWFYLNHILKTQVLKQTPAAKILRISKDTVVLRPNAEAAMEASEVWILEHGAEELFQEYVTAQEDPDEVENGAEEEGDQQEEISRLQARIAELESQAKTEPANLRAVTRLSWTTSEPPGKIGESFCGPHSESQTSNNFSGCGTGSRSGTSMTSSTLWPRG